VDTVDPLHFGNFAGLAIKLVWFVLGLLLSSMALSGAYLHYERIQAGVQGAARHRWRGYGVAIVAAFVVLGLTAVGGWIEIRSYGPVVDARLRWPEVPAAVAVFIASWVLVTCGVLAVWGAAFRRRQARRA
jgi:uncharacterized iron-regulated membrane protein